MIESTSNSVSDRSIIKRQIMYFGPNGASPEWICTEIEEAALILGAKETYFGLRDGWWCISADIDWLSAETKIGVDASSVFDTIWAFTEAGKNCYRSEAMARIFSSACVTLLNQDLKLVSGKALNDAEAELLKSFNQNWVRTVAFKFDKKS